MASRDAPARRPPRGAAIAWLAIMAACAAPQSDAPDLILTGGVVYPLGASAEPASALAVRSDTVLAVGDDASIRALAGDDTQEMRLDGSYVLPGFADAWMNPEAVGRWSAAALDLRLASTPEEVQAMVRNAAPSAIDGWLVGWGWDETAWPDPTLPDRSVLDAAGTGQRIVLYRRSGRVAWLGSAALEAAGIDASTPDPDGGRIARAADGQPTGILLGSAVDLIEAATPAIDVAIRRGWIEEGLRQAASNGVTRVVTAPVDERTARLYVQLVDDDAVPLRVELRLHPDADPAAVPTPRRGADSLRVVAFGLVLDGPLAPRLARLEQPYADSDSAGMSMVEVAGLQAVAERAVAAGLDLHVVAHGDAAVVTALESASVGVLVGADLLPEPLPAALAGGEVHVAIVPLRFAHEVYWLDTRLGAARASRAYAWRTLEATGVPLAAASDAPSEPLQPLAALRALVLRQNAEGYPAGGWHPEEALGRVAGLRALAGAPAAPRQPLLRAGAPADLVVWSEDPMSEDPETLSRAQALVTIVAGRVTFTRPLVELPMTRRQ